MIELSKDEKELLKKIVADKYSVGSFAGMIFNNLNSTVGISVGKLIKEALRIRLLMESLASDLPKLSEEKQQ